MMTMVDLSGIMQNVSLLRDIVETHRSMRNFNELAAAVSKVNAELMEAQAAVLSSYKEQLADAQHISELEKKIMQLEDWNREAERYQLAEIAPGVFAYSPKPGMEHGEPPHYLCANCFAKREKSILQANEHPVAYTYRCLRCKENIRVTSVSATVRVLRS